MENYYLKYLKYKKKYLKLSGGSTKGSTEDIQPGSVGSNHKCLLTGYKQYNGDKNYIRTF